VSRLFFAFALVAMLVQQLCWVTGMVVFAVARGYAWV
jgi:hypothetical protein